MLTKLSKTYSKSIQLNIDVLNLPQEQIITNDSAAINVIVKGIGFNLIPLEFKTMNLKLDSNENLANLGNTYLWTAEQGRFQIESFMGASFEVVSIKPDSLLLHYESLATKKVPVSFKGSIGYTSGYDSLKSMILNPDTITIIGPESDLKSINGIDTELVNLGDIQTSIDRNLKIDRSSLDKGLRLSHEAVNLKVDVEKFTEGNITIPIVIENMPQGKQINYFPKTASITYNVALKDFKSIKESDFKVVCDFSEINEVNLNSLTPKIIDFPSKVKNIRLKSTKVDFIIME